MTSDDEGRRITRLVGVYEAEGTLRGEISYWLRARFGGAHCALCDITHGSVREKDEWKRRRATLGVPVETVHLDERDDRVRRFTEGRTPCVVADTGDDLVLLVDAAGLEACEGSPERLVAAITAGAAREGLTLT